MADDGTYLRVTAKLPGMNADEIELSLNEGVLTLKGEKKVEESKEEEGF